MTAVHAIDTRLTLPMLGALRVCVRRETLIREVLPSVGWNKRAAVRWILGRLPGRSRRVVMYISDDAGNEAAFAAIGREKISVVAGRRKRSLAQFVCHIGDVHRLLQHLTQAIEAAHGLMVSW